MHTFPTIYKKSKTEKVQEWTIEVEDNRYRTIAGQQGGKKQTSEWTICHAKNTGKANATDDDEQAMKEAEALRKKKLEHGYFEDINQINQKQYFEPMLAESWDDRKDEVKFPLYSQPKLDGVRCIVTKEGMFSRNGKQILSAPHIFESLSNIFNVYPHLIFDGELYADSLADNFNRIISLVRKTKPTAKDLEESRNIIQYHIYDIPSYGEEYHNRYYYLQNLFEDYGYPAYCTLVETKLAYNQKDMDLLYEEYLAKGYEGQMLRVLYAYYENKRSKYLLKRKTFTDEEFTILDICEGVGNRTGTAGYMVFERAGQQFNSNIKCTFEEGAEILKNREKLIGKTATVKYFNLTPSGVPRFPYVINIAREDYE